MLEEKRMKVRCRINIWKYLCVSLFTAFALVVFTAVQVPAAPTMSQELKMMIMNRMPIAHERGKVLQSAARAIEGGFQEDLLYPVVEKSLDRGIQGDALAKMIETPDMARRKGLPTQPYTEKIMEGLAKRVSEDRILAALYKVGGRMEIAAALVGKMDRRDHPSISLVVRTGGALAAGMDRTTLEDIYDGMAHERVNRIIKPEDIMEMVKVASGYGVDSKSVGDFAVSLMKSRKSDQSDIRRYLEDLSENAFEQGSDNDRKNITQRHSDDADDGAGEEEGEEEGDDDDSGKDDEGSGGDDPEDDGPGDDEPEDDEHEEEEEH